jgi:hypothetical protein
VKYAAADSAVRATVVYTDAEWVSALTSLGISGVNTSNISAIKTAIVSTNTDTDTTNNNGAGVDSYNELQSLVSLVRVNDYAKLNTGYTLPTIEDYQALLAANSSTASDAKSSNLGAYNDAVNWKLSDAFTGAEVKDMVLSYNKILTASNGTLPDPATSTILKTDYEKVGVSAGLTTLDTPEWLALLNDVVANKTTTQVDQVSELNALASVIVKVKGLEEKTFTGIETDVQKDAIYDAVTGGRLSVDDLTLLGLNTSLLSSSTVGLTLANKRLETVYDGIIAINHLNDSGVITSVSRATLDTLAEMQTLINNTSGTSVISA